jgi:hypothetical protein
MSEDEDMEWEVTSDPPTPVTASCAKQAGDERVRLELESPPDEDPTPRLFVRPAGSTGPWEKVYPTWPPLTIPEDI